MKKLKVVMMVIPIAFVVILAVGYYFAPHDPNHVDLLLKLKPPSSVYPFGTDSLGRCVLSRLLYGGRTTLGIVLMGSFLVLSISVPVGLVLGYSGKGENVIVESLLNAFTAIPPIALLIVFVGAWGSGVLTMLTALTLSLLMRMIKLVKTETEIQRRKAYVSCAIACGVTRGHLLFVQILPNIMNNTIRFLTLSCGDMIMGIVSFSFIGIGLGDNVIDWGMMVSDARRVLFMNPALILFPIGAIFLSILSFNVISFSLAREGDEHA